MNDSLFAWVIENLTKNAVDAMEGQGEISLKVEEREKVVLIDLADTGKVSRNQNSRRFSIRGIRPRNVAGD